MKNLVLCIFLVSCSSIKMRRPRPELYKALKEEKLFGKWRGPHTELQVDCTGAVLFVEYRNGKVFNKDKGGHIDQLDPKTLSFTVSSLLGKNRYHYKFIDEDTLQFSVGKRADWLEGAKSAAAWFTIIAPEHIKRLKRMNRIDCDSEPESLGEVLNDMKSKLKNGEFETSEPDQ